MKRIFLYIRRKLIKLILSIKQKTKPKNSFIIFSEARGGSTWLMEMLSFLLNANINWEPLHVNRGVTPDEYNFGWRPFLPKEEINSIYLNFFEKVHSFSIHNDWTRSKLYTLKLIKNKNVLTKYVRANLLIPYLLENFNFKYPPIFLLRHPIDTCMSQIKTFDIDEKNLALKSKIPSCINNERFIEHYDFIIQLESILEIQIAKWCMNNYLTLHQLNELNLHIVFYSDLLLNPKKELEKILELYSISRTKEKIDKIDFSKPSSTDFKGQFLQNSEDQLYKNFRKLDDSTKNRIQKIFDYFKIKLFDTNTPFPKKQYVTTRKISSATSR